MARSTDAPLIDPYSPKFLSLEAGRPTPVALEPRGRVARTFGGRRPGQPNIVLFSRRGIEARWANSDGFALQLRPLVESFKAEGLTSQSMADRLMQTALKLGPVAPGRRRRSAACHEDQVSLAIFEKRSRLQSTGAFSGPTEGDKAPPVQDRGTILRLARRSGLCRPIPLITLRERPN